MPVLAAVAAGDAEEEGTAPVAVCDIAADGDVDGKSDHVVEEAVDKAVLQETLIGDVSAFAEEDARRSGLRGRLRLLACGIIWSRILRDCQ